jgi:hypothetical protein
MLDDAGPPASADFAPQRTPNATPECRRRHQLDPPRTAFVVAFHAWSTYAGRDRWVLDASVEDAVAAGSNQRGEDEEDDALQHRAGDEHDYTDDGDDHGDDPQHVCRHFNPRHSWLLIALREDRTPRRV